MLPKRILVPRVVFALETQERRTGGPCRMGIVFLWHRRPGVQMDVPPEDMSP